MHIVEGESLYAEFVRQLALRCPFHADSVARRIHLRVVVERMTTATVRPYVRESDLDGSALLEQQSLLSVEDEDAECSMQPG